MAYVMAHKVRDAILRNTVARNMTGEDSSRTRGRELGLEP